MKTTVTIVHLLEGDSDDVWIDVTNDEGQPVDTITALGIVEFGKALLIQQAHT